MACNLVDFSSSANSCSETDGGIAYTYVTDCENITDVTFDAVTGELTNFVMAAVGKWAKYEYDTDSDVPYYNQIGERNGKKHTTKQTAFFGFSGVTAASVEFANTIKKCCCIVAVHFLNSGVAVVQGITRNAVTGNWEKPKKYCKATVSVLTDTGANEERVEITLESESKTFSPVTTLTSADLEAL